MTNKNFPHSPRNVKITLSPSFPNLFRLSFVSFVILVKRRQKKDFNLNINKWKNLMQ